MAADHTAATGARHAYHVGMGAPLPIRVVAGVLVACAAFVSVPAADWPQWRGPARDGAVADAGPKWPPKLSADELKQVWRADVGVSFASPVVAGDRVFSVETTEKQEIVRAFDRGTGKPLWQAKWAGDMTVPFFAWRMGSWVRSTPAVDAASGSLFVGGMRDVLVCLNVADGSERWRVDFVARYKSPLPPFGFVSSPLVGGDFVYVQAGGAVVKLKKATGESVWRAMADGGGMNGSAFSSPILANVGGADQLLVQTRTTLAGLDPETGKELWGAAVPAFRGMNIVDPVVAGADQVFTSAYGGGSYLFKVERGPTGEWGVRQVWKNATEGYMGTPVLVGGHVYLHGRDRKFRCIDIATGRSAWTAQEGFGEYWSMAVRGDRILALDCRGEALLIRATPERFDLLDRRKVADQETWGHVATCGDEIWVRELRALSLWRWK